MKKNTKKKSSQKLKQVEQNYIKKEKDVFMKLGSKLKAYFFTGILVTAPVAMTFYLAYKLIVWVDVLVNKMLPPKFLPDTYLPFTIPGLGFIVLIGLLIVIGMFATGFLGKFFLKLGVTIFISCYPASFIYNISICIK